MRGCSDQLCRIESTMILQQRIILTMGSLPQIGNNSEDVFYAEIYERMGKMLRLIKINNTRRAVDVREFFGHSYAFPSLVLSKQTKLPQRLLLLFK